MKSRVCPFLQRNENLIHQSSVRPSRQRVLLRFAHFGGSHHLHCFGDLRGVADRSDPAPYVLRVRHLLESSFRPVTSGVFAHVKSDLASLRRFWRGKQTFQSSEKIRNRLVMRAEAALKFFELRSKLPSTYSINCRQVRVQHDRLAANQMDSAFQISDFTPQTHGRIERLQTSHRQVVLNSSSAAFNCDSRSLSSSFFSPIAPSNPSFRVCSQS